MPATPGGIRASIKYQAVDTAEVAYNVLHFQRPVGSPSFALAVDALHNILANNGLGNFGFAWQLVAHINGMMTEVTYYNLDNDPVTELIVKTTGLPLSGGSLSPALPYQVALGASLRTANDSRRGRGRVYLPYLGGAVLENTTGKISAATATELDMRLTSFRDSIDSTPLVDYWGVFSRLDNTVRRVQTIRIGEIPDTIRRRRNKRGEAYTP